MADLGRLHLARAENFVLRPLALPPSPRALAHAGIACAEALSNANCDPRFELRADVATVIGAWSHMQQKH